MALSVREVVERYLAQLDCKWPRSVACQLKPVVAALGDRAAAELRGADLSEYRAARLALGRSQATVNRELAYLRAAWRLAVDENLLERLPRFRMAREENVRDGFVTLDELERICAHLRPVLADLVRLYFHTGWRRRALLQMRWGWVSFGERMITLPRSESRKSREPVRFPLEGEVLGIVRRRRAERSGPWVFHRSGRPIRSFRDAWRAATKKAGMAGLYLHDLRRSMAHRHLQLGIPQAVTMKLAGWKTDSIYRRYAICDERVLRDGLKRAESHRRRPRRKKAAR